MEEGDSTLHLLNYNFRSPKTIVDESEDEIFFGPVKGEKELHGMNSKNLRRRTRLLKENQDPDSATTMDIKEEMNEESGFGEDSLAGPSVDETAESYVDYPVLNVDETADSVSECPGPEEPFESWFTQERDMLVLYEFFGEFYDLEFDKLDYEEKKRVQDKVRITEPKSVEELMALYPEDDEQSINESLDRRNNTIPFEKDVEEEENEFHKWFKPMEEIILFDLLGINYKDIFDDMSHPQRVELRLKVDNTEPKSREEILAMLEDGDEEEPSDKSDTPEKRERLEENRRKSCRINSLANQIQLNPSPVPKPRTLISPEKPIPSPRQMSPSSQTPLFKTPSSRKIPKTPNQRTLSYLKPTASSALRNASPKSTEKPCPRYLELSPGSSLDIASLKSSNGANRKLHAGIDLSKVVSPVAQYIHSNPISLLRTVKAVHNDKNLVGEVAKKSVVKLDSPSANEFAAIPDITYKSSRLVRQQEVAKDFESEKELPKSFGKQEVVEAKIIRHVGRVKVPSSLQWKCEEELINYEKDFISSPITSNSVGKPILKKTVRDSVASLDESMVDMSLHEIKAVQMLKPF